MSRELKCERCGASFTCQPQDVAACQCGAVTLSAATRERIAERFGDCLCARCLRELAAELVASDSPPPPPE